MFDLHDYIVRQNHWSEETSGPRDHRDHRGPLKHLRKEIAEATQRPDDVHEFADLIILAIDAASRAGHAPNVLISALVDKQRINRERVWPDWRTMPAGQPIEHDRSGEPSRRRVYIAGPMRGKYMFNFPEFDAAAATLREAGFEAISPAEMDREIGFDPATLPAGTDWNDLSALDFNLADAIRRDVDAILRCHYVCLLPGWWASLVAAAEAEVAKWAGLRVFTLDEFLMDGGRLRAGV